MSGFGDIVGPQIPSIDLPLTQLIETIRMFIRDYPELNRLIKGEEHSDRLIAWAIVDALDEFNSTPPMTSFGLNNFPSRHLLIRRAVLNLLESVGLLTTRNHLTFSDGGIQLGLNDRTQLIQSWIQLFNNTYEEKKNRLKQAINIEGGWGGGIFSEYRWTSGFYGGWMAFMAVGYFLTSHLMSFKLFI